MSSSFIRAITAASLLTTTAAAPAVADNLGAALVGGLIGGVIVNEANKNKRRTVVRSSGVSSATRAHNRETQTALNYFGFQAGTPMVSLAAAPARRRGNIKCTWGSRKRAT